MKILRHPRPGFSLIEVTIALGIAAFCLITVFALLPIGINTNNNAFEQTTAAGIATAIAADLHGTPVVSTLSTTSSTSRFNIIIPTVDPSQSSVSTPANQTMFFTTAGAPWTPPGQTDPVGVDATVSPGNPPPHYRATITFQPEDTSAPQGVPFPAPRNKIFRVWILITWPALADASHTQFPANFSGSYEVSTALDCN
jgi:type II secretory pathway pseudopilin PulG